MSIFDEIREARDGATPGPWMQNETSVRTEPHESSVAVCVSVGTRTILEATANAHLIALAPRMAEIVLAAEELAKAADEYRDAEEAFLAHSRKVKNPLAQVFADPTQRYADAEAALDAARAAFRKAVENTE